VTISLHLIYSIFQKYQGKLRKKRRISLLFCHINSVLGSWFKGSQVQRFMVQRLGLRPSDFDPTSRVLGSGYWSLASGLWLLEAGSGVQRFPPSPSGLRRAGRVQRLTGSEVQRFNVHQGCRFKVQGLLVAEKKGS